MEKTKNEIINSLKYCADSIKIYGDKEGFLEDHQMKLILLHLTEVGFYFSKELNRRDLFSSKKGYEYRLLDHLRKKYPDESVE